MGKKIGVLRFPGTNCDRDIWQAVEQAGHEPHWLWHKEEFSASNYDAYILPGGFSYGDYLRSGALSAHSPVMTSLKKAAEAGAPIFGICNGFQILCEAGLLPGVLMRNKDCRFIDRMTEINIENQPIGFSQDIKAGVTVSMPIAHADGCYFVDEKTLSELRSNNQIFCTYGENPNGSVGNIAGVMNKEKNVVGMMPHPERALYDWMGSDDGRAFFA